MATLNRTYQNAVNNANQNREYAAESTTMKDWYLRNAKDYDRKAKAALPKLNSARKDVARLERQSTRITSYNVCYTKLLRNQTIDRVHNAHT